ncbi:MAG: CapA family protein [Flavobacteriaceae bacterium]|nr:CapA family protein [Flavobacteriaceae bacterium]
MKIALLGDIAFFGKFSVENNKELHKYFNKVTQKLKSYDLVIGNLETPFAHDNHVSYGFKSAYIKSSPKNIELLKLLNIDVVNLANNHIYDFGPKSYELTKSVLDEHGIKYFGIEDKELVIETQGNSLALNGFCCYSTNPLGIHSDKADGINELNFATVANILTENAEKNLFNIFSVHCGQEHVNYPNYDHVQLARRLSEIAPYVFYGHHPHVIQGIEKVRDSLIAYSLGNFCFDDVYTSKSKDPLIKQTRNNKESFILELEIDNNKLKGHKVVPIFIGEEEMVVGDLEITEKLSKYSEMLSIDKSEYITHRNSLLHSYISLRKKKRDLNWYLKRLNLNSVGLILFARLNAKKYKRSISLHLDEK